MLAHKSIGYGPSIILDSGISIREIIAYCRKYDIPRNRCVYCGCEILFGEWAFICPIHLVTQQGLPALWIHTLNKDIKDV